MNSKKGFVIRCHDLFDGSTRFMGVKGVIANTKSGLTAGDTYSLTGARRAISNMYRLSMDPDKYQLSIERLDEFYLHLSATPLNHQPDKSAMIEHAMQRLDELKENNSFHNGDKMRINEVKDVLRFLKQEK